MFLIRNFAGADKMSETTNSDDKNGAAVVDIVNNDRDDKNGAFVVVKFVVNGDNQQRRRQGKGRQKRRRRRCRHLHRLLRPSPSSSPSTAAEGEPLLEIKDFDLIYRTEKGVMAALRKINLTINRGEVLGLVGESGCGKSSLISSILRLLPENAGVAGGEIRLGGTDMLSLSENEMRRLRGRDISIVFQNPMSALNPVLSIGRQMEDIQFRESVSRAENASAPPRCSRKSAFPTRAAGCASTSTSCRAE